MSGCRVLFQLTANVRVDFSVIGASVCSEFEPLQLVVHSEHRARIYVHDVQSDQLKMQNVQGAIQKVSPGTLPPPLPPPPSL